MTGRILNNGFSPKNEFWKKVMDAIHVQSGGNLDLWFRQVKNIELVGGTIEITVPNNFTKQWIDEKYSRLILSHLKKLTLREFRIKYKIENDLSGKDGDRSPEDTTSSGKVRLKTAQSCSGSGGFDELQKSYTFDNFVEGPDNELACRAAKMVAYGEEGCVSPVFIYGSTGIGKTHLLFAVRNARTNGGKGNGRGEKVICISAEAFVNQFVYHLSCRSMDGFRELFRKKCSVLLIDDIHFISSKQRTQEEFYHCFNELYREGKKIVMTSDRPPSKMTRVDGALVSRFGCGLVAAIRPPQKATRIKIIERKAKSMGILLDGESMDLIAEYAKTSVREIEGMLIRLKMQSGLKKVAVSRELIEEVSADFTVARNGLLSADEVIKSVARVFGLKISDVRGKKRHRLVTLPRQMAMFICREYLSLSYPEIAMKFGGKNHSTVIASCKKMKRLLESDAEVGAAFERVKESLGLLR